jgi:hypothetical protein
MVRWLKCEDYRKMIEESIWAKCGWMHAVNTREGSGIERGKHPLRIKCFEKKGAEELVSLQRYGSLATTDRDINDPTSLQFMALLVFEHITGVKDESLEKTIQWIENWKLQHPHPIRLADVQEAEPMATPTKKQASKTSDTAMEMSTEESVGTPETTITNKSNTVSPMTDTDGCVDGTRNENDGEYGNDSGEDENADAKLLTAETPEIKRTATEARLYDIAENGIDWNLDDVDIKESMPKDDPRIKSTDMEEKVQLYHEINSFYDKKVNTLTKQKFLKEVERKINDERRFVLADYKVLVEDALRKYKTQENTLTRMTVQKLNAQRETTIDKSLGEMKEGVLKYIQDQKKAREGKGDGKEEGNLSDDAIERGAIEPLFAMTKKGESASLIEQSEAMEALALPMKEEVGNRFRDMPDKELRDSLKEYLTGYFLRFASYSKQLSIELSKLKCEINQGHEALLNYNQINVCILGQRATLRSFHEAFQLDQTLAPKVSIGYMTSVTTDTTSDMSTSLALKEPIMDNPSLIDKLVDAGMTFIKAFDIFDFDKAFGYNNNLLKVIPRKVLLGRIVCLHRHNLCDYVTNNGGEQVYDKADGDISSIIEDIVGNKGWKIGFLVEQNLVFFAWDSLMEHIDQNMENHSKMAAALMFEESASSDDDDDDDDDESYDVAKSDVKNKKQKEDKTSGLTLPLGVKRGAESADGNNMSKKGRRD